MYIVVTFSCLTNDCLLCGQPCNLARGLAPLPPLPPSYGPSQSGCGGLRELLTPPGVQHCLAAPLLEVIGGSSRTRARVSPRLGLAPAVLLGQVSPVTLSTRSYVSVSSVNGPSVGGPLLRRPPLRLGAGGARSFGVTSVMSPPQGSAPSEPTDAPVVGGVVTNAELLMRLGGILLVGGECC